MHRALILVALWPLVTRYVLVDDALRASPKPDP